jgi:hypothetical protein
MRSQPAGITADMNFLPLVFKAVELIPLTRRYLHGMKIISPVGSDVISAPSVQVRGSYNLKPTGDWILLTTKVDQIWPQSDVLFDPTKSAWSGTVFTNPQTPTTTIQLVRVNPDLRILVNYFRKTGPTTTYSGINLPSAGTGFVVADEVTIKKA